jgi:hypothetical protein
MKRSYQNLLPSAGVRFAPAGQVLPLSLTGVGWPGYAVPVGSTQIATTTGMEAGNPPAGQAVYGWTATGQPLNAQGAPITGTGGIGGTSPLGTPALAGMNNSSTMIMIAIGAVVVIGTALIVMSRGSSTRRNPRHRRHYRRFR